MKNFDLATINALASRFLADLARDFDMPELAVVSPTLQSTDEFRYETNVVPRGQLALIIEAIKVQVTVYKFIPGILAASVETSYTHHNGGKNGKSRDFRIITSGGVISNIQYRGYVDGGLFDAALECVNDHREGK